MLTIKDIAAFDRLDTPFYYYDMDLLERTLTQVKELSAKYGVCVHYAVKANNEPRILRAIAAAGLGADCVTGWEISRALECGFEPSRIMFAGVGKTDREIAVALAAGIGCFNVESFPEMGVIAEMARQRGVKAPVAFRINPNIDAHTHKYITTGMYENKFGISDYEFEAAAEFVKANADALDFKGIQFHIGSQITEVESVFTLECQRMNEIVDIFTNLGVEVRTVDLGGGLGIDYEDPDGAQVPDFAMLFKIIGEHLTCAEGRQVHIEPGRAIVAQCGSLITRVVFVKKGQTRNFLITDAGMNDLIRPALYSAYHKIENLTAAYRRDRTEKDYVYDVVGPVCESADVWGQGRMLRQSERGDFLAIRSAGAYGSVMASAYNLRPLAPAVFSDEIK